MLWVGFGDILKFGVLLVIYDGEVVGYFFYIWNYFIWNGVDYMNMDDLFVWEVF